jgi:glycopeptide antibiotics resistance protein
MLFILYIIFLAYFLFFSERYGRTTSTEEYRYNLTLFKEVKRFIMYRKVIGLESFLVNIIGNVFAFAPFGFVLPIISRDNRKFLNVTFLSFEFSLTIELIQLLFKVGIFDVDDILMNTVGGLIGYLCFSFGYASFNFFRKADSKRKK